MKINEVRNDRTLILNLEGRLDTATSPELKKFLDDNIPSADAVILDLEKLDYVSSAGLRVILSAHKALEGKGGLTLRHPNKLVMQVFELTGFQDVLNIEA